MYSPPDEEDLLAQSYGALLSCTKLSEDSFCVIEISLIQSVVAMIPHSIHSVLNDRYFLVEKTGMQIVHCGEEDASNTNTVQLLQQMGSITQSCILPNSLKKLLKGLTWTHNGDNKMGSKWVG